MTKLKVYIDFEAISSPFDRKLKVARDFPYAYSIGVWSGKKFKTSTFIFNFSKDSVEDVDAILRRTIIRDVRRLTGKRDFMMNKDSTQFVSYAPALEKKVLSKVYKGIEVIDISKGAHISLEQATEKWAGKAGYFKSFKEYTKKHLEEDFIQKRGLNRDGALAAYAGYILYAAARDTKAKMFYGDIILRDLVKELVAYSVDDVVRMKYIEEHLEEFFATAEKRGVALKKRSKLISRKYASEKLIRNLENLDQKQTIGQAIKMISKDVESLQKEIDNVEV